MLTMFIASQMYSQYHCHFSLIKTTIFLLKLYFIKTSHCWQNKFLKSVSYSKNTLYFSPWDVHERSTHPFVKQFHDCFTVKLAGISTETMYHNAPREWYIKCSVSKMYLIRKPYFHRPSVNSSHDTSVLRKSIWEMLTKLYPTFPVLLPVNSSVYIICLSPPAVCPSEAHSCSRS